MDKRERFGAVEVLKLLRQDVREMPFERIGGDGHTLLVSKPAVLELIQDWIEQSLNPELNEATESPAPKRKVKP
jgi:hypothetical protein